MLLPPQRPRLIALDMDGTICDSSNAIPPENIAALRACRAAGIHIAVLTGRRRSTLRPQLELLYSACEAAPGSASGVWLAATNSGGLVWEYPGWRQQAVQTMPPELAALVLELLLPYSLNCYVNPAASDGVELVHLRRQPSSEFAAYFTRFGQGARQVSSAAELLAHEITQFALPAADAVVYELAARLRALEAYSPSCNKAQALELIAQRLGVAQERVAAAGDDQNDMPMLRWAGHSAVMPHTSDEVAAAAPLRLSGRGVESLAPWLHALAALPAS